MTEDRRKRRAAIWEAVLELLGAGLIVAGVALWAPPLAFVLAGIAVLLIAHPLPITRWIS